MDKVAHLSLTQRDVAIIAMVHSFGGCTVDCVRRLVSAASGSRSACYARINRLVTGGYLLSTRLPSQTGTGSGRAFLLPGPKARRVLAQLLGISRAAVSRIRTQSAVLIHHHLAICDVRVAVELASERAAHVTLVDWTTETELRRAPLRIADPGESTNQPVPLIPDAAFNLGLTDGTDQHFYLEVDMATVPRKRLATKLRLYLALARSQPAPVLFVVPDDDRKVAIVRWAQEEAGKLTADPTIFWVTTRNKISEQTVLSAPIWQIAGGPESFALTQPTPAPSPAIQPIPVYEAAGLSLAGGLAS